MVRLSSLQGDREKCQQLPALLRSFTYSPISQRKEDLFKIQALARKINLQPHELKVRP